MVWVRFDDGFAEHMKVSQLSDAAFRLHVSAILYCGRNLTDGLITTGNLRNLPSTKRLVAELVKARVWEDGPGGYVIHDYLDYNPSREEVLAAREQRAEAGRIAGQASAAARRRNAERNSNEQGNDSLNESLTNRPTKTERNSNERGNEKPTPVPRPVPVPPVSDETGSAAAAREMFDLWSQCTGTLITAHVGDQIDAAVERCGPEWVADAIRETGNAGARTWNYTARILDRWVREGRNRPAQPSKPKSGFTGNAELDALIDRIAVNGPGKVLSEEVAS